MYQIDITGPIEVGKSTIIESIKSHFENVVHIPEYINGDENGIVMCDLNTYNNEVFDNPNMFIINLELQKINYFNQVLEYEGLDVSNVIKLTSELNDLCNIY